MKLWIVDDEYDYFLTEQEWPMQPCVEVSDALWKRYQANRDEHDVIQDELHHMYRAARAVEKAKNDSANLKEKLKDYTF